MQTEPSSPDVSVAQVRPWIRFWARSFDGHLAIWTYALLLAFVIPDEILLRMARSPWIDRLATIPLLLLWTFVEGALISRYGTTPGKYLLGIRVIRADGSVLSYEASWTRSIRVWWRGLGAGIPLVSLVTMMVAYDNLDKRRRTTWDRDGGCAVLHEEIKFSRAAIVVVVMALGVAFKLYGRLVGS